MYFYTFFHPHIFSKKNINNITKTMLLLVTKQPLNNLKLAAKVPNALP